MLDFANFALRRGRAALRRHQSARTYPGKLLTLGVAIFWNGVRRSVAPVEIEVSE